MKGIYTRKHEWHCPYCIGGVWSKRNYEDMLPLIAEHKKSHMKPLKKHPKQQRMEEMTFPLHKEKNIWTGREYLRSINDDNGFTLLPRLTWRIVAVGVLVGAIIISFYIYGKR